MAEIDSKVASSKVFAPYQWEREGTNNIDVPGYVLLSFAEKVQAVAYGCNAILHIEEVNSISFELDDPKPYFNANQMGRMLSLVRVSIEMLGDEAERLKEWAYEHRTTDGALESYHSAVNRLKSKGIPLPTTD
jgi:hypothetical protein